MAKLTPTEKAWVKGIREAIDTDYKIREALWDRWRATAGRGGIDYADVGDINHVNEILQDALKFLRGEG